MIKMIQKCVVSLVVISLGFGIYTYWSVERKSAGLIYDSIEEVPSYDVGVVLGTSQFIQGGRDNVYFTYRINAARELYRSDKVKKLLVSGDNSEITYNEPLAMQQALIEQGVPAEDIILDYAGFRTLDSMVRARDVFGQETYLVISQPFHVKRAVYIARMRGIAAAGFAAQDIAFSKSIRIHAREVLARAQAWIDIHILNKQPKFLGESVEILINESNLIQ